MTDFANKLEIRKKIVASLTGEGHRVEEREGDVEWIVFPKEGGVFFISVVKEFEDTAPQVVVFGLMKFREEVSLAEAHDMANALNDFYVQGKMVVDDDRMIRFIVALGEKRIGDYSRFFNYAFSMIDSMENLFINSFGESLEQNGN